MRLKPCLALGCPELVPAGQSWCSKHASVGRPGTEVYASRRWQGLRRLVLNEHPFCSWPGCMRLATQVDHIVPLPEGPAYDPDNLQGLCLPHHGMKTRAEAR